MDKKKNIDKNEKQELELKIKEQIENHNKLLKKTFIIAGILVIIFLSVYLFFGSMSHLKYKNVSFIKEKYCDAGPCIVVYKTSIPITYPDATGKIINADYNIYLRNNPKELSSVPVKGNIIFRKNMVISVATDELFCEGDWNIALGNLQKLSIFGINFIAKNQSEIKIYTPSQDYMYVNIMKGNETMIEEINENNYNVVVNNCEILKATERLMLEAFVKSHEK